MDLRNLWSRGVSFLVGVIGAIGVCTCAYAQGVPVAFSNNRSEPIQLNFTLNNPAHSNGPITWGVGCEATGTTAFSSYATIKQGTVCNAVVDPNAGSSRFCATTDTTPTDCMNGQANHLTLVETTFQPGSAPGCFSQGNCVWYDISVIPKNCTDELWKKDRCTGTGGASYNLPVVLSCKGSQSQPIYICKGPVSTTYGPEMYPSKCGNPDATCATGTPHCVNGVSAYFRPMYYPPENSYQPNAVCLKGTFTTTFVSGP